MGSVFIWRNSIPVQGMASAKVRRQEFTLNTWCTQEGTNMAGAGTEHEMGKKVGDEIQEVRRVSELLISGFAGGCEDLGLYCE